MAEQMRCQKCHSLGLSTDVLCQRCGGTLAPQGSDPTPVNTAERGSGPQPSPQPAGPAVADGQPVAQQPGRSRSWLILVAVAAIAVAVLVGTMLMRHKPALQASADAPADRIVVTNTTDQAVTVSFRRRNADGDWVNVRNSAGDKRTLKVKANDTASVDLRAGTYVAVATINGAPVQTNEVVLSK